VPRDGAIPLSTTLDSIGPLARSVACCAILDAVLADEQPAELSQSTVSGLRFAVAKTFVLEQMEDEVAAHFERSLSQLSAAGAHIEALDIPELAEVPNINAKGGFAPAESYAWHRRLIESSAAAYDPRVLTRIQKGASQTAVDYIELLAARRAFIDDVEKRIAGFDALLMPTTPMIPPRIAALQNDADFARINALALRNPAVINLLDGCAISVPNHSEGEPPTGLMLCARGGQDRQLLRHAAAAADVVSGRR
jgi:aspartyl-tRNA(Asn)/glutamyl-tRNA(Gln) amidotransferase subunit A